MPKVLGIFLLYLKSDPSNTRGELGKGISDKWFKGVEWEKGRNRLTAGVAGDSAWSGDC